MLYKIKNINDLVRVARKKSEKKGWRRTKREEMQQNTFNQIINF